MPLAVAGSDSTFTISAFMRFTMSARQAGFGDGGHIRQHARSRGVAHAKRAHLAALQVRHGGRPVREHHLHLPAQQVLHGRRASAIRDVLNPHPGHRIEEFARQMRAAAGAGRAERELARVLFGVGDQFAHRVHGQGRVHHQHDGKHRRHADRHEVAADVVAEVVAQAGQHRVMDGREEEVVAVGLGLGRELRTDDPARARLVAR
ncbi:hypothetical protein G6F57_019394 [Rhizopus arrhizus]|nr:hypothetical protein G6F57_019394 [Rhizopus arrhizus]